MAQVLGRLKKSQKLTNFTRMIQKLLENDFTINLEFIYAKKGDEKWPNILKIRTFAKLAKMAIFVYFAKGVNKAKMWKMTQFWVNLKSRKVDKFDSHDAIITTHFLKFFIWLF